MSKIYRSLDPSRVKVTEVDYRSRTVGPAQPDRPAGGFCGFGPADKPQEVLSHLERRQAESIRLLEEARRQAETIQRDAYRAGFEQGERAGGELARQKVEPFLQAFAELLEAVGRDRAALIHQHEQELIKVAFVIAMRVLHTTIELEPAVTLKVVEAALAKVSKSQKVTLKVTPYDRQLIECQMDQRQTGAWPPAGLTIEADESICRGGCKVITDTGDIDATIETQLRVLKNMLWGE